MNFKQFMDGPFKKIEPWADLVFFILISIAGGMGISAKKENAAGANAINALGSMFSDDVSTKSSSGTGGYTFFQVLYWIAFSVILICKVAKILRGMNVDFTVQNKPAPYAQANYGQQQMQGQQPAQPGQFAQAPSPVQGQPAPKAGGKFCTVCGAQVPEGNAFCVNCGNKVE
ncbi:MAG: zinc ribbon domain-containing protein [Ruminococcus sp.]|nr:zinc ribbon domain-containing protein [Ruminococcus sp.]